MTGMDVSVIVATRNRCDKLESALESLERLAVPDGLRWEVVVVDNGSTDGTARVCGRYVKKDPKRFACVRESRKGKSRALNRGLREASGEVIAFTDDDCVVDRDWLRAIDGEFRLDPELAVVGGRVELQDETDRPVTVLRASKKAVVDSAGLLFPDPPIIGCNLAVKKDVFGSVGGFDERLGPGTAAKAAEDLDLVYRAFKEGFKAAYSPLFVVYHAHGRKSEEEERALLHDYYIGRGAFYAKHYIGDPEVRKMAARDLLRAARRVLIGKGRRGGARFMQAMIWGALSRTGRKASGDGP